MTQPQPVSLANLILNQASWLEEQLRLPGPDRRRSLLSVRGVSDLTYYVLPKTISLESLCSSDGPGLASLAEFSVETARRRQIERQELSSLLIELKGERKVYLDLLDRLNLVPSIWAEYSRIIERLFDLLELQLCRDWPAATSTNLTRREAGTSTGLLVDQDRFRIVFEHLPYPVILVGSKGRLELYNEPASRLALTNLPPVSGSLVGEPVAAIFPWLVEDLACLVTSPADEFSHEKILVTHEGARNFRACFRRIVDGSGAYEAGLVFLEDTTERKIAEEQIGFLGSHDRLTGLYNRAFFEEELARLRRGRVYPISVLTVDVDDLKLTNDTLGDAAGDGLLRRVAGVLRASFRAEDVVARVGGDEFAVLLPGVDSLTARSVSQRFLEGLRGSNQADDQLTIDVSIGIGTASRPEQLPQALIRADEEMSRQKNGKPLCRFFTAFADRVM